MDQEGESFGIKKVIDCKIEEGGKRLYKVRWEETWEPADTLAGCQHLIDRFWSSVERIKMHEYSAQEQQLKIPQLGDLTNNNLGEDNKRDIQMLISRTSSNQVDPVRSISSLVSPSAMLYSSQVNTQHEICPKAKANSDNDNASRLTVNSSPSSLKYLENFKNPYVRAIVVCIKCSKEQPLKFPSAWKTHFLRHLPDSEKPHQCSMCDKGYVQLVQLTAHMKTHLQ